MGGRREIHLSIPEELYSKVVETAPRVFGGIRGSLTRAVEEALVMWLENHGVMSTTPRSEVMDKTPQEESMDISPQDMDKTPQPPQVESWTYGQNSITPQLDPPLTDDALISIYQETLNYVSSEYADKKLPENVVVTVFIDGVKKALKERNIEVDTSEILNRFHKAGWIEPFLKMREPIDWPNAVMIKIKEREPRKIPKELPL